MNKQRLASKIWESANKMRSKIEANEYKDYILGFIFYKYLSDQEVKFLKENDFTDEDIKDFVEQEYDDDKVKYEDTNQAYCQRNIGYFIEYKNLFSTWIEMGRDFDVSNVTDALSAFNRLISPTHRKVFNNIFQTLETGLNKLGDSSGARTKAIQGLLQLIKDIPMNSKQDYDVLGFIYEYLIGNFAANAGKKAGEFYTPQEVSILMSEIVANHLKGKHEIKIYDPTSGSGSLLINIGNSVSKYMDDKDNIKYYAQELKENTYNLTRMNLVMRGIKPDNIVTRNGDTLEEDWPYFEEDDPVNTYDPLYVDAVVSNPPYSQAWDPTNKENDPRYSRFGLAPKGKADYAFLLHDLFHIKPDGIMTIVLPHGVLFRGGEEAQIRKNLIEYNHIDTIIGLPANIFYGTGIPTIVMVLKQRRNITDTLIIDASKGFIKEGKNNKLRASDIKKIVDTVVNRETIDKFSRVVSKEEIRKNDYNLNIPRYVDSSGENESWDIYASMFGGIPLNEINDLYKYWNAFPELKESIFDIQNESYANLCVGDISVLIKNHLNIIDFEKKFKLAFNDFSRFVKSELIEGMLNVPIAKEEGILSDYIFNCLKNVPLIDKYTAYQTLHEKWNQIAIDLEMIQTEGVDTIKRVEPNIVIKKKDGKEQEIQEGWMGHIIPFELVQNTILSKENDLLKDKENRLLNITSQYDAFIDLLSEEDKESSILNDANDAFVPKEVNNKLKEILNDLSSPEINALHQYNLLKNKVDKIEFTKSCKDVNWSLIQANNDGTYSKSVINAYIKNLQENYEFEENTVEYIISNVSKLLIEEKNLKAEIKTDKFKLDDMTKKVIENLTDEQIIQLLEKKWIDPLLSDIAKLPSNIVDELINKVKNLQKKYEVTYFDIEKQIRETEKTLCSMIDELEGDEFDMKGLNELKSLLSGESYE